MMFWKRLGYLLPWRRRAAERDMQDELRSIAQMAAPGELGNLTIAAEDARAELGWTRLEQTGQDLRYAVRTLRKSPGFTAAAVLSLAIGIGANTALFSLINTVLWKTLPVADPEHAARDRTGRAQTGVGNGFTYQQLRDVSRSRPACSTLAALLAARLNVSASMDQIEPTRMGQLVTGELLPAPRRPAGDRPAARRSDDRVPMATPVAVLSHAYWQRRFASETGVVGRSISFSGVPFTIVGVAPAEFFGAEVGSAPELFVPVHDAAGRHADDGEPDRSRHRDVGSNWLRVLARLTSGVPVDRQTHGSTRWPARPRPTGGCGTSSPAKTKTRGWS